MSCFVTAIHRPFSFLFIPFWKVLGTLLPRGQFTKEQLSYLLRQLDPKLGTPQATEFLEHFFPAEDYISCRKLRLFRKKHVVTPVGGLDMSRTSTFVNAYSRFRVSATGVWAGKVNKV